jgi:hypothetical protein
VDDQFGKCLLEGIGEPERVQPARRDPARRGLAFADLVAVDHQHVGTGTRELTGDRQAGEARPTDEDVAVAVQSGALVSALGGSLGHRAG